MLALHKQIASVNTPYTDDRLLLEFLDMSYILEISSEEYSEWVVRNSLYWISEFSAWELEPSEKGYQIELKNSSEECICRLHRLLNDFKLRSKLMNKTQPIREKIIIQALKSIEEEKNDTPPF